MSLRRFIPLAAMSVSRARCRSVLDRWTQPSQIQCPVSSPSRDSAPWPPDCSAHPPRAKQLQVHWSLTRSPSCGSSLCERASVRPHQAHQRSPRGSTRPGAQVAHLEASAHPGKCTRGQIFAQLTSLAGRRRRTQSPSPTQIVPTTSS